MRDFWCNILTSISTPPLKLCVVYSKSKSTFKFSISVNEDFSALASSLTVNVLLLVVLHLLCHPNKLIDYWQRRHYRHKYFCNSILRLIVLVACVR